MIFFHLDRLTVCDLNLSVDAGSRVQQQFYLHGLQFAPRVLLGQPLPFGREYRPGILHIDRSAFQRFQSGVQQRVMDVQADCYLWRWRILKNLDNLRTACHTFEADWARGIINSPAFHTMLLELRSLFAYNVLYELYPETEILEKLHHQLRDQTLANELYTALHHTDELPHYTRVNLGLLELAQAWITQRDASGHGFFIRELAFAFDFYIDENELEHPASLLSQVQTLAATFTDAGAVQKARDNILAGRRSACLDAQRAWSELLARLSADAGLKMLAALSLRSALASEEEERHFLQMRVQRNCRDALDLLGLPRTTTPLEVLSTELEQLGAA